LKRVLVTGARGFVGRHCLAPAVAAGFDVWATTSTRNAAPEGLEGLGVKWRSLDILAPGALENLLAEIRPTHMLHMAWETTHGSYWSSPANLDWLAAGAKLFRAFPESGGERLVVAGTCAEYDWGCDRMVENEALEHPATLYGRIKLAHHHAMMAAAAEMGFSAATGRIFFAYGPYENAKRIIPYACHQIAMGKPAEFGSGRLLRDFMYVEDVAAGFVALLNSDIEGACNVSSGAGVSLAEIVMNIGKIGGRPDLIRLGTRPDRPDDPPTLVGDNAKLRATGWVPSIPLDDGLRRAYFFFATHGFSSD
jgi:nucleoside-diphosphate-sugar epimerase